MVFEPLHRHSGGMTRPRLRRHRSAIQRPAVPVGSLMPLWSLAGGCDVEDDDEVVAPALAISA